MQYNLEAKWQQFSGMSLIKKQTKSGSRNVNKFILALIKYKSQDQMDCFIILYICNLKCSSKSSLVRINSPLRFVLITNNLLASTFYLDPMSLLCPFKGK